MSSAPLVVMVQMQPESRVTDRHWLLGAAVIDGLGQDFVQLGDAVFGVKPPVNQFFGFVAEGVPPFAGDAPALVGGVALCGFKPVS
jgi:hypothetical protein